MVAKSIKLPPYCTHREEAFLHIAIIAYAIAAREGRQNDAEFVKNKTYTMFEEWAQEYGRKDNTIS